MPLPLDQDASAHDLAASAPRDSEARNRRPPSPHPVWPPRWVLVIGLLGFWLAVWRFHYLKPYSDPLNYLTAAENLRASFASGKWPVLYPAILRLALEILGRYGVFFFNLLPLSLLFLAVARLARLVAGEDTPPRTARWAAPVCLLLVLQSDPGLWIYLVNPYRDPLAMLFLFASMVLLARGLRAGGRAVRWLLPAGLCLGLTYSTREPNILAILPMALFGFFAWRADRRIPLWGCAAGFGVGLVIGMLPLLLQSYNVSQNPFLPPQSALQEALLPGLKVATHDSVMRKALQYYLLTPGWLWLAGLVFGLPAAIVKRNRPLLLMVLPAAAVFIGFYGFYENFVRRYFLIVTLLLTVPSAYGWIRILALAERLHRLARPSVSVALVIAALAAATARELATLPRQTEPVFRVAGAKALTSALAPYATRDALILCRRNLCEIIRWFTPATSYAVAHVPGKVGYARSDYDALHEHLRDRLAGGGAVYVLAGMTENGIDRDAALVRQYFDLEPVVSWTPEEFQLRTLWHHASLTLYRVQPWSRQRTAVTLDGRPTDGVRLDFDAGAVWTAPRTNLTLFINDRRVPQTVFGGANYINLSRLLVAPPYRVTLESDAPLPAHLDAELADAAAPLHMGFGAAARPSHEAYLRGAFTNTRYRSDGYIGLDGPGRVLLPVGALPEAGHPIAAIAGASWFLHPDRVLRLTLRVDGKPAGEFTLRQNSERHGFTVPVPRPDDGGPFAELAIDVAALPPDVPTRRPSVFALSRISLQTVTGAVSGEWNIGAPDDTPAIIRGFHRRERGADRRSLRWTKSQAALGFYALAKLDTILTVTYSDRYRAASAPPADLRFGFNGQPVAPREPPSTNGDDYQTVTLHIPAATIRDGRNELTLRCTGWIPAAHGIGSDQRELGVMLDRVSWHPQASPHNVPPGASSRNAPPSAAR